jgi:sodium/proline symporter
MDMTLAIAFLAYLAVLIGFGVLAYRRTKTFDDYYLAGRKLNPWVTALSAEASSESGWLLLGLPGQAFAQGIGAFWIALGCISGTFFNWTALAKRLRKITGFFRAITIPDYLESRFEDNSHVLRVISALLIAVFMGAYVAAQFVASGKALSVTFGLDYTTAVLIGGAVILFYTMMGGFFAVAWTDALQALMMIFGLVLIPIVGTIKLGGPAAVWATLAEVTTADSGFLSLRVGKEGLALATFLIGMIGIGLGYPGQPHVLVRFMAIRKASLMRRSALLGVIWAVIALYGAVFVGLLARGLLATAPSDPERVMPLLAIQLLPAWLAGVMIAAAMAAMMSTADSQLLVASSSVVQDFYHKTFGGEPNPKMLVLLSRIATLLIGVVAILIALGQDPENPVGVVFWLVLYAWGGLAASFGPVLVLSVYWKRVTKAGAIAGMVTGSSVVILWKNACAISDALCDKVPGPMEVFLRGFATWSERLYELVPGLVVSLLAVLVVSSLTRPPSGQATGAVD